MKIIITINIPQLIFIAIFIIMMIIFILNIIIKWYNNFVKNIIDFIYK